MQAEPMRRHVTVERSLLICFVPRSGSWFLAGLLASTAVAGRPAEFFSPRGEEEARAANRLRTDEEPRFDFDQIAGLRRLIEDEDTAWAGWFKVNGIDTEQVFYEDLLADPRRELSRIVASLGLDLPTGVDLRPYPGYERQADAVSFEWCSRYRGQSSQNTLTEQAR